jgi:hypothetical protein
MKLNVSAFDNTIVDIAGVGAGQDFDIHKVYRITRAAGRTIIGRRGGDQDLAGADVTCIGSLVDNLHK